MNIIKYQHVSKIIDIYTNLCFLYTGVMKAVSETDSAAPQN